MPKPALSVFKAPVAAQQPRTVPSATTRAIREGRESNFHSIAMNAPASAVPR